jgi:RNA polymerase sigma factor (sigma-70 family)
VALAKFDERKARTVELHYFGGLSHAEIAQVIGVHLNTVARDLRVAEAWLHSQLRHA